MGVTKGWQRDPAPVAGGRCSPIYWVCSNNQASASSLVRYLLTNNPPDSDSLHSSLCLKEAGWVMQPWQRRRRDLSNYFLSYQRQFMQHEDKLFFTDLPCRSLAQRRGLLGSQVWSHLQSGFSPGLTRVLRACQLLAWGRRGLGRSKQKPSRELRNLATAVKHRSEAAVMTGYMCVRNRAISSLNSVI